MRIREHLTAATFTEEQPIRCELCPPRGLSTLQATGRYGDTATGDVLYLCTRCGDKWLGKPPPSKMACNLCGRPFRYPYHRIAPIIDEDHDASSPAFVCLGCRDALVAGWAFCEALRAAVAGWMMQGNPLQAGP